MTEDKEIPATKMPSEMLTAHLLALLKNWSGYGYELAKKLEEAGYGGFNSGTLYRTLRQMEKTGLISSLWDTSSEGPARRIYSLTKTGSGGQIKCRQLLPHHFSEHVLGVEPFLEIVA